MNHFTNVEIRTALRMALKPAPEKKLPETGGGSTPPQPAVYPRGASHKAPIPESAEMMQAQVLIREAGSPELAKTAVDEAAELEGQPDFREDMFARRFGFTSRHELLAASTPLTAADGTAWWTTAINGNRWIVWNQEEMAAEPTYATVEEARNSVYPAIAKTGK